jgi:anaerobic magnesium-protoporphyrin IX monomethyl ester cyclase
MHILLIQPSQYRDNVSLLYGAMGAIEQPPMGLAMIGAVLLGAGHEVDLIDIDAQKATIETIDEMIARKGSRLVGMSVTAPVFMNAVRMAEKIKERRPEVKMVLGGYHPSLAPAEAIAPACIDFVVKGEGERTVVELAAAVAEGADPARLATINGLYFKRDGQIVGNPDRELIRELDDLPFPARQLFDRQRYTYPDTRFDPAYPLYTSRGCPGQCTFCLQQYITGRKLRFRSAGNVADEIQHLVADYGAREIHIWDDMFTCNRKRVFEIRDEFKKRGIKVPLAFTAGIRVDTASEDILAAMREMGGYAVAFGVESGSQEVLDRAKKGIKLDEVRTAVKRAKAIGFETWCFFMLGLMGDTRETIEQTIRFAIELDPDVAKFHVLKPYPGSEIHRQMEAGGFILDHNVENYGIHTYPVHRTETLSPEDIYRFQQMAYRRFYLRPRMIFKHALRLNSWARWRNNVSTAWGVLKLSFKRESG